MKTLKLLNAMVKIQFFLTEELSMKGGIFVKDNQFIELLFGDIERKDVHICNNSFLNISSS
jgi:hypothetical protein